jgi:hypothetical protein
MDPGKIPRLSLGGDGAPAAPRGRPNIPSLGLRVSAGPSEPRERLDTVEDIPEANSGPIGPREPPEIPALALGASAAPPAPRGPPDVPRLNLRASASAAPPDVPALSLGASAAPRGPPDVPRLNLSASASAAPPDVPPLGLGEGAAPPAPRGRPEIPAARGIPALNLSAVPKASDGPGRSGPAGLSFGLGLASLPTAPPVQSAVLICVPYAELATAAQLSALQERLPAEFNESTEMAQIRKSPPEFVIENRRQAAASAIPSLQALDAAFQDTEHLPFLIDQADTEAARLSAQTEHTREEIEALRAEKETLAIDTALLRERLRAVREETRKFAEAAARVKRDFDVFLGKVGH